MRERQQEVIHAQKEDVGKAQLHGFAHGIAERIDRQIAMQHPFEAAGECESVVTTSSRYIAKERVYTSIALRERRNDRTHLPLTLCEPRWLGEFGSTPGHRIFPECKRLKKRALVVTGIFPVFTKHRFRGTAGQKFKHLATVERIDPSATHASEGIRIHPQNAFIVGAAQMRGKLAKFIDHNCKARRPSCTRRAFCARPCKRGFLRVHSIARTLQFPRSVPTGETLRRFARQTRASKRRPQPSWRTAHASGKCTHS